MPLRVPASTWNGLVTHIRDHIEANRLARSADERRLYCYAIPLYQYVVATNDRCAFGRRAARLAAERLADLLAKHGDLDELRALTNPDD